MEKSEIERFSALYSLASERERRSIVWAMYRLNRRHIKDLATGLGIETTRRSIYALANDLVKHFNEPVFECVGCGGLTEAKGLRWKKLGEGKPVTVSIDHSGKPETLAWLTDEIIMQEWFKPWADENPIVKFKLLKTGKGDCHIKWERIDGPSGTLAFVWQPAGDATYMEEAGDLSGDMIADNSEYDYRPVLVHEAGKHEVGHVLGIGHLDDRRDVMFASARGEFKNLSTNDKNEIDERHPA